MERDAIPRRPREAAICLILAPYARANGHQFEPKPRGLQLDTFVQSTFAMSFGIYLGGIVLVLGGLVYAAAILHTPVPWIIVGALVLLGLGILAAVKATRQRDPAG